MGRWLRSGILRRILLSILLVSLLPIAILGGLTLRSTVEAGDTATTQSQAALDAKSAEALELQAVETAKAIADFLNERETDLRTASLLPYTADAYLAFYQAHKGELWFVEQGQEAHRVASLYREMAYIDPTGREIIKIIDGRIAGAGELYDVSNPANTLFKAETYFNEARQLALGEVYVSQVVGYYVTKAEFDAGKRFVGVLRFAMPVFDQHGRLEGVVELALDSRHLREFTAHIDPSQKRFVAAPDPATGNYAYIIDGQSYAIAHPTDYVQAGLGPNGECLPYATTQADIGSLPVRLDKIGFMDTNLASIPELVARGKTGSIQYHWAGHDKFVAYAPILYH